MHFNSDGAIRFLGKIFFFVNFSMNKTCLYLNFEIGFNLQEHWINSPDPAAPHSNSTCLKIGNFGETATGSIISGQYFYQNY